MIAELKKLLESQLPGEDAHHLMMPVNRPLSSNALKEATEYRLSGVAVVLFKENSLLKCVLIKRTEYKGSPHSGQISFPGGKKDQVDPDTEATARRECFEEVNVDLSQEDYIGSLTPVFIPVSRFLVYPHVYFVDYVPHFIPETREVDSIITFNTELLKDDSVIQSGNIRIGNGLIRKDIPYFNIHNEIVWGATAMMLAEFRELLLQLD